MCRGKCKNKWKIGKLDEKLLKLMKTKRYGESTVPDKSPLNNFSS